MKKGQDPTTDSCNALFMLVSSLGRKREGKGRRAWGGGNRRRWLGGLQHLARLRGEMEEHST